jgi:hypothetical protein
MTSPALALAPEPEPAAEAAPQYYGQVIIEWPAAGPRWAGNPWPHPLPGWGCRVIDAMTGRTFLVMEIQVDADAHRFITADVTMFATPEGRPLYRHPGEHPCNVHMDDAGQVITGTFRFLVAEMRVAARDKPAVAAAGGTGE